MLVVITDLLDQAAQQPVGVGCRVASGRKAAHVGVVHDELWGGP